MGNQLYYAERVKSEGLAKNLVAAEKKNDDLQNSVQRFGIKIKRNFA